MTGRGIGLQHLKKKDAEAGSSAQSTSAPSAKSSITMLSFGRGIGGRGLSLPDPMSKQRVEKQMFDEACGGAPAPPSTVSIGRGRGVAGRGLFGVKVVLPQTPIVSKTTNSDPIASGSFSDPTSKDADTPRSIGTCTSGIIAGRGLSSSVKDSSEHQKPPSSSSQSGAIRKQVVDKLEKSADTSVETAEQQPVLKHGEKGMRYSAICNAIELRCDREAGVFEYEVRFAPAVDNLSYRYKYLNQHKEVIGAKTFDGVILYLPRRLNDATTRLVCTNMVPDQPPVKVEIIFKRKQRLGECLQLYNVLFERIFKVLDYLRVGRKMFNPRAPQLLPQHKLEIWPGYVKSVEELEGGLMLTLDVSHRVLATRTVLEVFTDAYRSNPAIWKEEVKKAMIGKIVLTRYNNKTYRVDDIVFDQSPSHTFQHHDGPITYVEYYKKQYNIDVQDLKQPLLLSRKEIQISGEPEKREYIFCMLPELCYMTGLTDKMRKNYTVMKDLATYTKLTPYQRVLSYKKYVENVNSTPEAKSILNQWGLSIDSDLTKITARLLDEERILFGHGKDVPAGPQADFSRHATTNQVLEPIDLLNWMLIYVKTDKTEAKSFEDMVFKVSGPTGMRVQPPRRVELQNDRTETFVNALRKELNDARIQIVVILFPSLRDDRYAAVKRVLCSEIPLPSQVIHSKTLRNETKNRSIVQKIVLQMNCKMGGTLWGIKIPLKKTMICGIDTHHETGHKGLTVGGFVASLNPEFTRWFSKPTIQEKREELVNGLTAAMESALTKFKVFNNFLPDTVILYRDGVGNGQFEFVKGYEIQQFKDAFKRVAPDYSPKLTFIIVQKRINSKFFRVYDGKTGPASMSNPPPGSILDHTITSRYLYDFYMVSQHSTQGATNPSHYIVLEDESNYPPDIVQRLTYKLCFLYYNWPGTVRVPAPCQYAHKLADLVGVSIKRPVAEKLEDKLYFL